MLRSFVTIGIAFVAVGFAGCAADGSSSGTSTTPAATVDVSDGGNTTGADSSTEPGDGTGGDDTNSAVDALAAPDTAQDTAQSTAQDTAQDTAQNTIQDTALPDTALGAADTGGTTQDALAGTETSTPPVDGGPEPSNDAGGPPQVDIQAPPVDAGGGSGKNGATR